MAKKKVPEVTDGARSRFSFDDVATSTGLAFAHGYVVRFLEEQATGLGVPATDLTQWLADVLRAEGTGSTPRVSVLPRTESEEDRGSRSVAVVDGAHRGGARQPEAGHRSVGRSKASRPKGRRMSDAGRAAISRAQKKRWRKAHRLQTANATAKPKPKRKRKMTEARLAAIRANLVKAQAARRAKREARMAAA